MQEPSKEPAVATKTPEELQHHLDEAHSWLFENSDEAHWPTVQHHLAQIPGSESAVAQAKKLQQMGEEPRFNAYFWDDPALTKEWNDEHDKMGDEFDKLAAQHGLKPPLLDSTLTME